MNFGKNEKMLIIQVLCVSVLFFSYYFYLKNRDNMSVSVNGNNSELSEYLDKETKPSVDVQNEIDEVAKSNQPVMLKLKKDEPVAPATPIEAVKKPDENKPVINLDF